MENLLSQIKTINSFSQNQIMMILYKLLFNQLLTKLKVLIMILEGLLLMQGILLK